MKIKRIFHLCLAFFTAITISQTLLADEVWNSTYGKVIYEDEIGKTALWNYNNNGILGLIYINNLAGVYTGRKAYDGYWVQETSEVQCKTHRMMKDKPSFYWGRFHIQFLDPNFPSRWQAKWSYCNNPPKKDWQGTPD